MSFATKTAPDKYQNKCSTTQQPLSQDFGITEKSVLNTKLRTGLKTYPIMSLSSTNCVKKMTYTHNKHDPKINA